MHTYKQVTFIQSLILAHLAAAHPPPPFKSPFFSITAVGVVHLNLLYLQCPKDGAASLRICLLYIIANSRHKSVRFNATFDLALCLGYTCRDGQKTQSL